jgi:uncharacterized protein YecE (DUF72 family)
MNFKPAIYIGTSGWSYSHWSQFYKNLPSRKWLPFYAEHFSTVEINSTYYHLPQLKSVKNWLKVTPKDFVFSVKCSRYITHVKRLKDVSVEIENFLSSIAPLEAKLGPLLFLLPPSFGLNFEVLKTCIEHLPKRYEYTFEFRNESWYVPQVYELLRKNKIALCISDLNGILSPIELTAPFVYVRLHGPHKAYKGRYSLQTLRQWAKRALEWKLHKLKVYIYFDNDEKGYAIKDAQKLIVLLSEL